MVKKDKDLISLKGICREVDMDPRMARIKLREKFPGNRKRRWCWDKKAAEDIKKILKNSKGE